MEIRRGIYFNKLISKGITDYLRLCQVLKDVVNHIFCLRF